MKGYTGKMLHVDLSKKKLTIEEPEETFYRKYLGGSCLGVYYVVDGVKPGTDALDPENILAFTISPVVGAPISGASRFAVTAKSPLTDTIASSEAGGFWAPELKYAGFDGIIVKGKSEKPVYLWIHEGEYELKDASHIWGKQTGDAQEIIRRELKDEKIRIAQIGPGSENLSRFGCIVNELKHFNGRNGLGAVMGSKNLKAIAVRGTTKPDLADPDKIQEMARRSVKIFKENPFFSYFRKCGTTLNVEWNSPGGGLPTKNWTTGTFAEQDKLMGEVFAKDWMERPGTCSGCIQSCKRDIKGGITHPVKINPQYGGPEYETIGMCGSNLLIGDIGYIAALNQIASANTLDTISLGGVIGFAMECYEKGILKKEDLGGIELNFGNGDAAIAIAEMIVKREGIGDLLAEGTGRAAKKIGKNSERFAVVVKNKEFPAHMPTMKGSLGLIYAVNPFGPDHVSSEGDGSIAADPIGERVMNFGFYKPSDTSEINFEKAKLASVSQRYISALDSTGVCQFIFNTWSIFGFGELVELINAATGWNYSLTEFMVLGERRINMMKLFNMKEGFDSKSDILPDRMFEDPLTGGPSEGKTVNKEDFFKAREAYYQLNGWNKATGNPEELKVSELGLEWMMNS